MPSEIHFSKIFTIAKLSLVLEKAVSSKRKITFKFLNVGVLTSKVLSDLAKEVLCFMYGEMCPNQIPVLLIIHYTFIHYYKSFTLIL